MKSFSFTLSVILLLLSLQCVCLFGQKLSKEQIKQIDSLFLEYHESPPVAYGILYDGDMMSKHFGAEKYRSIEKPVQFRLGGMAQHFTAYGILQLQEKGLIQFEDALSKYLEEEVGLDLSGTTIKHLLNHTHGLPEYWDLKALFGYGEYDSFTPLESKNMFDKKWNNNHSPGEKISFSGTGVYLLTKIIEKVTDKSFPQYMEENVFAPFKMNHTYFNDAKSQKLQNILSYENKDGIFEPQVVRHYDNGPGGLITTMEDLLIWFKHLMNKDKAINRQMDKVIHIDKDRIAEIPNGKITYGQHFMHAQRGINKIWDYGHIGGFASSVFRFPSHDLCIVSLSKNGVSYNGFMGMGIADIILKDHYEAESSTPKIQTVSLTDDIVEKFTGSYLQPDYFDYRHITLKNDTLRLFRPLYDSEYNMLPTSNGDLLVTVNSNNYLFKVAGNTLQMETNGSTTEYEKMASTTSKTDLAVKQPIGTFFSTDLGLVLSIKKGKDGGLIMMHNNNEIKLKSIAKNTFVSNNFQLKLLKTQLNAKNEIIGIQLSNMGFKDVPFRKVD